MSNFSSLLRRYREAANLTQAELARSIGSTQSAVGNWESGARKLPRADILLSIANTLKIPAEELFDVSQVGNPIELKSADEIALLTLFRSLPKPGQALALRLMRAVSEA